MPRFHYDADGVDDEPIPSPGRARRRRPRQHVGERDTYVDPAKRPAPRSAATSTRSTVPSRRRRG